MGKKILVVDNQQVMLKFMTELLEKEGHQVLTANNGLSALDSLKTYQPDVIFTNLIMPNISGEKLCQLIRKDHNLENVFVVILSGTAAEENVDVTQFGADVCIAKGPFEKMTQHVLSALSRLDMESSPLLPGQTIGIEDVYPRQVTKELLSVKRHFEVILASMVEGIIELTLEARIVYANPVAISLFSMDESQLLGLNFIDLLEERDRQRIRDRFQTIKNHPRAVDGIPPVVLKGRQIALHLLPVIDEGVKTIIVILNDISEQKRMEAQLLMAQKMEAIGTLAGGIAHDFNNLLMAIQGNASLMLSEIEPTHPHYERLKSIEKQVQSGSKLTSQLLAYARKGRYDVRPIDLNKLVEEISETFGRTRKEIIIHRELAKDLSPTEADQGQIEQVLMNLLVNAADAMAGGGELFLKTANATHEELKDKVYHTVPGDYVLLIVRDTGIGMDKKIMERIFEPFFTTKELGRGTGLGLASVYGIIKGHGGYIDVESEKGKGATFKIYLPASVKKIQKVSRMPDEVLRGTESILLVDDEAIILDTGEAILKRLGYKVLLAESGKKAVEVYKANGSRIDMVILDMVMPRMGGGEVFDRLKEVDSNVKVLLSSGYSIDGEAGKILKRGCHGFIQKPFDIKQLSQSIRAILDKKS